MSEKRSEKTFEIGDEIVYAGSFSKIAKGTHGVVIGLRNDAYPVAVKFFGCEGMYHNLDGLDESRSSLWCSVGNLTLVSSAGEEFFVYPEELEGFLS